MFGLAALDQRRVGRTLARLAERRARVLVEVEQYNIRFTSVVGLRSKHVVIPRPRRMPKVLHRGSILRFADPDDSRHVIRLEIEFPAFLLTNGNVVIICALPQAFAEPDQRVEPRYNTRHLRDLAVILPERGARYRVLDLSAHGCKLLFNGNRDSDPLLNRTSRTHGAQLLAGGVGIHLDSVLPRAVSGNTIGCSLRVADDGTSPDRLANLLRMIERQAATKLVADPSL